MMLGEDDEINDPSLEVSEDLIDLPKYKRPNTTSLDFDGLLRSPLLLHEDLTKGCGGQTWPAGMVLAKYLLREPQLSSLRGKTILELGAGGGLVGLALARALSSDSDALANVQPTIHITDQEPMFALMQRNIDLNILPSELISASILDWGASQGQYSQPDVLIAAECVYFEPAFPLLLQTMTELIGAHTECYFCFKKRRRADLRFVKEAKKKFKVTDVIDDPDRGTWSKEGLFFYRISAK